LAKCLPVELSGNGALRHNLWIGMGADAWSLSESRGRLEHLLQAISLGHGDLPCVTPIAPMVGSIFVVGHIPWIRVRVRWHVALTTRPQGPVKERRRRSRDAVLSCFCRGLELCPTRVFTVVLAHFNLTLTMIQSAACAGCCVSLMQKCRDGLSSPSGMLQMLWELSQGKAESLGMHEPNAGSGCRGMVYINTQPIQLLD